MNAMLLKGRSLILSLFVFLVLLAGRSVASNDLKRIKTVFLIVLENVNWSAIKGSGSAPYINNQLLTNASYAEQYNTAAGVASSLVDYLWLEAGTSFGINDSGEPRIHTIGATNHFVTLLRNAGISWKSYQEDISGTNCPSTSKGLYAAYHNPFVYFDDIISEPAYCWEHNRPYAELTNDLQNNTVARYNFITPNLCHDMHNASGCATPDRIRNGDDWLATEIPEIMNSPAFQNDGAIFITWDEGTSPNLAGPIGMIVLSKLAKGGGYSNRIHYTHASTLRTMQEIFGVEPLLAGAAGATSLSDLFRFTMTQLKLTSPGFLPDGSFQFAVTGPQPGKINFVEASTNLINWMAISTNVPSAPVFDFTDRNATNFGGRFYRVSTPP
jgi:hypothetical protein